MLILGIDTSCDDTAAAVVDDGRKMLSNVVSNQNEIHQKYGGIVPELASRRHIEMIWPIVDEAMERAGVTFKEISAIAVTHGPGLIGSLLVGVCFAKSLSLVHQLPLVAVNHLEGHVFSVFLEHAAEFPFIAAVFSGGHTSIYLVHGFNDYSELGRTRDDAAGEAFDKVAKLLGYQYPGGPVINKVALKGNHNAISFPRADLGESLDFSFSGLKTSVLNHIRKNKRSSNEDIAASFQAAVIDVLVENMMKAAKTTRVKRIALSGGVAANSGLRETMKIAADEEDIELYLPSHHLCTDNAAMTAAAGFFHFKERNTADYSLNPKAYLPLRSKA